MTTPELDRFEVQFWRSAHCVQEERFGPLYSHCRSLAKERDRLEDYISALSSCESKTRIRREDITRLAGPVDFAHKYSPDKNMYSQSKPTATSCTQ
jgi:hypothetical protein